MAEISLRARLRGVTARCIGHLPPGVQLRLSRTPAVEVDGQTIDPTIQLFLSLRPRGQPRPLTAGSPEEARTRYRNEMLSLRGRLTPVGRVRELQVDGAEGPLRARHYAPPVSEADGGEPQALLVFFHGGGFALGDLDTHDEACRLLCLHGHQHVLSVEYRLAPEFPFPAAVEDAEASFRWAQANAEAFGVSDDRVAVGGDSAGGNLAAVISQRTAGDRPPLAQLLIYPPTDRAAHGGSAELFDGFFLSVADRETFTKYYYAGTDTTNLDPGVSPLLSENFSGLPPAVVVTAGFDVLRDEGEAYAQKLCEAGTPCLMHRESSQAHGFIQLTGASPESRRATVRLAQRWRSFLGSLEAP
jgi:acetyl esterase